MAVYRFLQCLALFIIFGGHVNPASLQVLAGEISPKDKSYPDELDRQGPPAGGNDVPLGTDTQDGSPDKAGIEQGWGSYPYLKFDFGTVFAGKSIEIVGGYARIGYELNYGRFSVAAEIGPTLISSGGALASQGSSSIFGYFQPSKSVQVYAGLDSVFADSDSGESCFNELTLGAIVKLGNSALVVDPVTGVAVIESGFFARVEGRSFWARFSGNPDLSPRAYLGWSRQSGPLSLNLEAGASAFSLSRANLYVRPIFKLDLSFALNSSLELLFSADHILWPFDQQPSATGLSISVIQRF